MNNLRNIFRKAPTDRAGAEKAIVAFYAAAGLRAPRVEWVKSPLQLAMRIARGRSAFFLFSRVDGQRLLHFHSTLPHVLPPDQTVEKKFFDQTVDMIVGEIEVDYALSNLQKSLLLFALRGPTYYLLNQGEFSHQVEGVNQHSAFWLPCQNVCLICERPVDFTLDAHFRPQSRAGGPAVNYRDGWHLYAEQGERIPSSSVIASMSREDLVRIMRASVPNQRLTSFSIDRYGRERFVAHFCRPLTEKDRYGQIFTTGMMRWNNLATIQFLRVENSTVGSDGKQEVHYLRIPPVLFSSLDAVAWTFNVDPREYLELQAEA